VLMFMRRINSVCKINVGSLGSNEFLRSFSPDVLDAVLGSSLIYGLKALGTAEVEITTMAEKGL